ncbi:HAD family hydrolase [Tumidithrix elongata RA019]|uniref:HAD family hydrolase n=1 Tax=Tumidithrix elongata BACA0141 TaxID=2716417 RepID=A0AAW9Q281_9CYAN|nr:HAD family hydrolase [Tumidithrix elongata RA019]
MKINSQTFTDVRLIATDVDGTLTHHHKFTSSLFDALQKLANLRIHVLLVTGRSAGWVSALVNYLPVVGAIAENGGIYLTADGKTEPLVLIPDLTVHRQQLTNIFENLKQQFPNLNPSSDNRFRLTDWTFDLDGLSPQDLQAIAAFCEENGWSFTYSTIQCHIKPIGQDKAGGIIQVLEKHFPELTRSQVVTLGDSPNDESMFNPKFFPRSVGVANVLDYAPQMQYLPTHVMTQPEVEGFYEFVELVVEAI